MKQLSSDRAHAAIAPNDTAKQFTELTNTKLFERGEPRDNDKEGTPDPFTIEEFEFDHTLLSPTTQPDSLGRLGKYEVHQILGSGAFGVVLKAFDEQLRRAVAIKILNRQFSSSATARRRFIREARAAAAVSHTNVVAIHAVEEQAGIPFLVMELVTGPSLRDRIAEINKLPPIEVIRLGAQIASGLAAAHAQGVVHRDIKPGNIMLEKSLERVKITDFGLARVAIDNIELTSRGMAMGTPAYMSPEQVAGDNEKIDGRSDLFALGCVLYAALVGHSPFHGRTALEMARKVAEYDPTPLSQLDPAVPQFLSDLVVKLLKKAPDDRYQSAAEVAGLLNRYLIALNQAPSDRFQNVIHDPLLQTETFPLNGNDRRNRMMATAATILALMTLTLGVSVWHLIPKKQTKTKENAVESLSETEILASSHNTKSSNGKSKARSQEITVSQSGSAHFRTINEALAIATPQTTIRVLDDATYRETLKISGAQRFNGLRLIAEKRARLVTDDIDKPTLRLVEITWVDDVVIKGWKIDAPKDGHAFYLFESGNILLDELEIEQPKDSGPFGAIQIEAARSKTDGPMEIKRCHVKSAGNGQCVWIHATNRPPIEIRLLDNRFERNSQVGTNVGIWLAGDAILSKLIMRGNLFVGGDAAVNMHLQGTIPRNSLELVNNTFYESKKWLVFNTLQPMEPIARIVNNLIVDCVAIDSPNLDEAVRYWKFSSNWWELAKSSVSDAGQGGIIAKSKLGGSLRFQSRDPQDAGFLRPAPDADWLEAADDGSEVKYIGAFGPNQTGLP